MKKRIILLASLFIFVSSAFAKVEVTQTIGNFIWGNPAWEPTTNVFGFYPTYTSTNIVYVFNDDGILEPFLGGSIDFGMMSVVASGLNATGGLKINFLNNEKRNWFFVLQEQIGCGYNPGFFTATKDDIYVMNKCYLGIGYMYKGNTSFVVDAKLQGKYAYLFRNDCSVYELGLAFSAGVRF